MRLRSTMYSPPGGRWFYTVPQTRRYFESSSSLNDLLRLVISHLETASLPVPADLALLVEDQMCRSLPKGACTGEGDPGDHRPGFFEVVEKSHKFFRGRTYVDARTAEHRAAVCRACVKNDLGMCVSCTDLRRTTGMSIGNRRSSHDDFLGVCRNHAVPTFGMIWIEGVQPIVGVEYPGKCWVVNA